jgi:hypothetical protein
LYGEVVEDDISSDFEHSAMIVLVGYPDKVAFGVFSVTHEASRLTAGFKFALVICDDACSAFCSEGSEMREVRAMLEP